ncbi:MAG: flagellar biosynthesis protein FlhF [Pseudomonadales bacterium]|nr:flagellar biosynthesis protein FlhF [Pseudomonadales bacterium]
MRIERFAADDMSRAIKVVKAAMGPEAVILSNTRVGNKIEILAASDYDESLFASMKVPAAERVMDVAGRAPVDVDTLSLQSELKALKLSLETELEALKKRRDEIAGTGTAGDIIARRLSFMGYSPEVISAIARRCPGDSDRAPSWGETLKVLGSCFQTTGDDILREGGVIALVGATGVGKTTTAAKLAAQFAFRHGRDQVALITTDTLRIGGQEGLKSYARALGVPMEVASTRQELASRVRSFRDRKLVLIDTAGMSQRDVNLARHLVSLGDGIGNLKSYLVLSCTSQLGLVQEVTKAFGRVSLHAAIITKTDEAVSLGPVLSGVIRTKLPVAYLCDGQDVPEDIEPAERKTLVMLSRELAEHRGERMRQGGLKAHA